MSGSLFSVEGLGISFGGVRALDNVSFAVAAGEIYSIIGPNGAGKTTLFNVASGVYRADSGRIRLDGVDVTGASPPALARRGLSRTFQNLQIFARMTAVETCWSAGTCICPTTCWRILSDLAAGTAASTARTNCWSASGLVARRIRSPAISRTAP